MTVQQSLARQPGVPSNFVGQMRDELVRIGQRSVQMQRALCNDLDGMQRAYANAASSLSRLAAERNALYDLHDAQNREIEALKREVRGMRETEANYLARFEAKQGEWAESLDELRGQLRGQQSVLEVSAGFCPFGCGGVWVAS